ncbi:hypothetical protein Barb4_00476 [Bacteroidales bacterium Barb4]|nr:hypothetical protein Barb4_00476 [Bacteroidales bacterium Barb4]
MGIFRFYLVLLSTGLFTKVLIHYAVAKIFRVFIWGHGFCGWACWTDDSGMKDLPQRCKSRNYFIRKCIFTRKLLYICARLHKYTT